MSKKVKYSVILILFVGLIMINMDTYLAYGDVGNAFSGSASSSSSSSDGSFIVYLLFYLIPFPWNFIVFGLLGFWATKGINTTQNNKVSRYDNQVIYSEDSVVNAVRKTDPNFSKYAFLTYAKECLITIQESIEHNNVQEIKPFVVQEYFNLINKASNSEYDYYYQGQEILHASIKDHYQSDYEYLVVELFVSEYYFSLVKGQEMKRSDYGQRQNNVYELTFKRKLGVLTSANELKTTSCPSCGAPNAFDNHGVCEYCNSEIFTGDYSFVVTNMNTIAEKMSIYYNLYHSNRLGALNNEEEVVSQIQQVDSDFRLDQFEQFVENSFISVQEAWEDRDLDKIRHFESTDLFNIHSTQIIEFIEDRRIPKIDDQVIRDINVNRFEIDGKYEYVSVVIRATLKVYVTDEEGNVVSGNHKLDKKRGYLVRYKRARGLKSSEKTDCKYCPNCGAEIVLGEFGTCNYCGSSIVNGEHGWIMDSYEAINKV